MFQEISLFTHQILKALEDLGFARNAVLKRAGIAGNMLTNLAIERIPLEVQHRMMGQALEISGDPAIFLKAGGHLTALRDLGMVGLLMASCPSPLAALLQAQDLIELQGGSRVPPIHTFIDPGEDLVTITFTRQAPETKELNWQLEATLISLLRIMGSISGQSITPISVSLEHPPTASPRDYKKAFQAPIMFEQDKAEIRFSNQIREIPCLFSSMEVNLAVWNSLLEGTGMQDPTGLKVAITRIIWQMILEGKRAALPDIAKAMGLPTRTIQHRLRKEGTSFADLLASVRYPEAKRMLSANRLNVETISHRLGYAEPASFHNAFRVWQGETPGKFRKKAKKKR